jgi:hypothetical protein
MSCNPLPLPESIRPSAADLQKRLARNVPHLGGGKPACSKAISVGLFFDGTNNNKARDKDSVKDKSKQSHSNVVRLFDAHGESPEAGLFRFYVPGVGTPFELIGEMTESDGGKRFATGGAARIQWALIQLINAVHMATGQPQMISPADARTAINDYAQLKDGWSLFSGKRESWFESKVQQLQAAIKGRKPTILSIDVSIFGFSRGAAEARAFSNWLIDCCKPGASGLTLAGVPLRVRFMGIFDTVASVGLADSVPLPVHGHADWADGTMRVRSEVEKCVHLVAAHEVRASFPLNCGRDGKAYPSNVHEVVYPGAHSDVGGGYPPNNQGRGRRGAASLLSQVPLNQMHAEALKAGVPLKPLSLMAAQDRTDFAMDAQLVQEFNAYLAVAKVKAGRTEDMLHEHMRHYRRYKSSVSGKKTEALKLAELQDQQDLIEADKDLVRERTQLERKEKLSKMPPVVTPYGVVVPPALSSQEQELLKDLQTEVHVDVLRFLDNYVHDSHAGFYLAGPVTEFDRRQEVQRVRQLVAEKKSLNSWEQKVYDAAQAGKPFPLMTDQDQGAMLYGVGNLVKLSTGTRREGTGYLRERVVFDKS